MKTQVVKLTKSSASVKKPNCHTFAMQAGDRADSQIQGFVVIKFADPAPIKRSVFLSNIHPGNCLDRIDEMVSQFGRYRADTFQKPKIPHRNHHGIGFTRQKEIACRHACSPPYQFSDRILDFQLCGEDVFQNQVFGFGAHGASCRHLTDRSPKCRACPQTNRHATKRICCSPVRVSAAFHVVIMPEDSGEQLACQERQAEGVGESQEAWMSRQPDSGGMFVLCATLFRVLGMCKKWPSDHILVFSHRSVVLLRS